MLNLEEALADLGLQCRTKQGRLYELFAHSTYQLLVTSLVSQMRMSLMRRSEQPSEVALCTLSAGQVLRDFRQTWSSDGDQEDAERFFAALTTLTASEIRAAWSSGAEAFFASHGLLERNGFMAYLTPAFECLQQLMADGTADLPPTAGARQPWKEITLPDGLERLS